MNELLVNICCASYVAATSASLLFFERLLKMEAKSPEYQRHPGGRAVGIFSMPREMRGPYPRTEDIKALFLGLRLFVIWLFRMPIWVRADVRDRRALWIMRSLFWLGIVGMEVAKETLL
jgi:hypothetical protein